MANLKVISKISPTHEAFGLFSEGVHMIVG